MRLDPNPWTAGPPPTLTHVTEADGGAYAITASEHPGGRTITIEIKAEHDADEIRNAMDTYSIWLEPPFASCWGGIAECVLTGGTLRILLTAEAADTLGVGPLLQFQLTLDDAQHALLRTGLRRTLSSGRADRRPSRLDV